MEWQTVPLTDLASDHGVATRRATSPEYRVQAASDYDLAAATVFPPLGASGDWRQRLSRVLDRRLQTGLGTA